MLTAKSISNYINAHRNFDSHIVEPFVCADGFKISIQASKFHYCSPQSSDVYEWDAVELGYPSDEPPEFIREYADEYDNPTETVYPHVPVELVAHLLNLHGGPANA